MVKRSIEKDLPSCLFDGRRREDGVGNVDGLIGSTGIWIFNNERYAFFYVSVC